MSARSIDVTHLPTIAFGHRSTLWWGTMGIIAIEATVFAMAVVTYFYLFGRADEWPLNLPAPELIWGTLNTAIMAASLGPNHRVKRHAEQLALGPTTWWLVASLAFGTAFLVVRVLEFTALGCRWDTNAYGSIVWTIMGLHTAHLLTDYVDSLVLAVVLFVRPSPKRFVDVSENAIYRYFVVLSWVPIYGVVYFGPRLL